MTSHPKMTSNPKFLLFLFLCFLLTPLLGCHKQAASPAVSNIPTHEIPTNYDGTVLFSPAEWKQMTAIFSHMEATRTLSVADMDYAAHLLRTPPSKDTPWLRQQRQVMVLAELTSNRPKVLTPAERRHLFDVVEPYTDSLGLAVRANAMGVLASSHDPRAVAVLERHVTTDPDTMNRKIAADCLRHLQQALGKPST